MGKSVVRITRPKPVPRLRDGDRLDVHEFLRRYAADPVVYSAELLKGVVHVTRWRETRDGKEAIVPPISADGHGMPHAGFIAWLGYYSAFTPGTSGHGPTTTVLPSKATGLEPDAVLRVLPDHGGRSVVGPDRFIHGVPELIAEVSYTSGGRDLGPKYDAFEADGVPEYLVWRTDAEEVLWFVLRRKRYVQLNPDADGVLRSEQFPGLWLDAPALLDRNMRTVIETLQRGLESPEHTAFLARLQRVARRKTK